MSAADAAAFMVKMLNKHGKVHQDEAAYYLHIEFGEDHVYFNGPGNLTIRLASWRPSRN